MNPYGQGGYVMIDLRRMTVAMATTTDLITTARTKVALLLTEIPTTTNTTIHTTIPTISLTSQATTTTDKATTPITTITPGLMTAALASPGRAVCAVCSKRASDEMISSIFDKTSPSQ